MAERRRPTPIIGFAADQTASERDAALRLLSATLRERALSELESDLLALVETADLHADLHDSDADAAAFVIRDGLVAAASLRRIMLDARSGRRLRRGGRRRGSRDDKLNARNGDLLARFDRALEKIKSPDGFGRFSFSAWSSAVSRDRNPPQGPNGPLGRKEIERVVMREVMAALRAKGVRTPQRPAEQRKLYWQIVIHDPT